MKKRTFNTYSEYKEFVEKKFPRREAVAAYAHKIACGWRVECDAAGRSPELARKAMTPREREAGAEAAAAAVALAWQETEAAQSWLSGTPLWKVREELLMYKGLDPEGYPLA